MIKDLNEIVMTVFADLNFIKATLWKLEFDKIMLSHNQWLKLAYKKLFIFF